MSQLHTLHRTSRRYGLNDCSTIPFGFNTAVLNWSSRIVANGGVAPSHNTMVAVNNFYNGLAATPIMSKIKSLNCYAPDNLMACLTPLINTYGNDPWTNFNNNFKLEDLTVNGLMGNGGSAGSSTVKYLDTGVLGTNYSSDSICGLTVYAYTKGPGGDSNSCDAGYSDKYGTDSTVLSFYRGNTNTFEYCGYNLSDGACTFNSTDVGYLSGNRITNANECMYFANSSNAHTLVGNVVTTGTGTRGAHKIFVHAFNYWQGGENWAASTSRISFAAIHDGLTSSESATFFTLIDTMRRQMGGGYV